MKKRDYELLAWIGCAIIMAYFLGFIVTGKSLRKELESSQKQCQELQSKLDKKKKEAVKLQDEVIILEQRLQYFEDLAPLSSNMVDFYQDGKKYKITAPQKVYEDYDCTKEVEETSVITSTIVVELIMNEDNSKYALRTTGNKLVWTKEEPQIKQIK